MSGAFLYYIAGNLAQLQNCDFNKATSPDCIDPNGEFKKDTVLPEINADADTLKPILQSIFAVIGFIAVITIVFAGYKYITSQGNPQDHKQAWQTIMYAGIGLLIALSAEVIVTFALGRV